MADKDGMIDKAVKYVKNLGTQAAALVSPDKSIDPALKAKAQNVGMDAGQPSLSTDLQDAKDASTPKANPPSYKRGGVVKKTGMAKVHKGERVLTKKQRSKVETVKLGKKGSFKVHPGALHKALGVPEGQKLGASRISSALHSKSPAIRRMAASAKGLTAMHHKG